MPDQPVIDPTANVRELVAAEAKRADDLRERDRQHIEAMMAVRAEHARELRVAESARLDAIRAVDAAAVQRAADVAAIQATTLAAQVATSAEAMRTQVQATAAAQTAALTASLDPIQKDIADLRRVQFQQQGEKAQRSAGRGSNQWVVATAISVVMALLSVVSFVLYASQ